MIAIIFNCFDSIDFQSILLIGIILYLIFEYRRRNETIKQTQENIKIKESIPRRSEEGPKQYPNGWLPILASDKLNQGQVRAIYVLGEDLVIYRGSSRKVHVFDAFCPHLGANLGVSGTVIGDDIKCQFHSWQFDSQGDCKLVSGLDGKTLPKASIRKWYCEEYLGLIFVWHHNNKMGPQWTLPKPDKSDELKYNGTAYMKTFCHFLDVMENFDDRIHFDTIHGTTDIPILSKLFKIDVLHHSFKQNDKLDTHLAETVIKLNLVFGFLTLPTCTFMATHYGPGVIAYHLNNKVFGIKIEMIFVLAVICAEPYKQILIGKWFTKGIISNFILKTVSSWCFDKIIRGDIPLWNTKKYNRSPKFTKLDETMANVRRFNKQFFNNKCE